MTNWNIPDLWEAIARIRPEATATVQGTRRLTWGDFDSRAERVGRQLVAAGLQGQSKVALLLYNDPEYLEVVFGALKVAMVPVNTNYRYQLDEVVYVWDNADAEAVVFDAEFTDLVRRARKRLPHVRLWICVHREEDEVPDWALSYRAAVSEFAVATRSWARSGDDLILIYTGGTTGLPKGVMWRQDDLFAVLNRTAAVRFAGDRVVDEQVAAALSESRHPPTRLVVGPPLMHGTGLLSALSALNSGGSVILLEGRRFDALELLRTVERERASALSIVGDAYAVPILAALDAAPNEHDISSLWAVVSSGMNWSENVKAGLRRHHGDLLLADTLGSSEALGVGQSRYDGGPSGAFALGQEAVVIGEDGRVLQPGSGEVGLLAVRGRGPIGYYKDPKKSAEVFRSIDGVRYAIPGDLACLESNGDVQLLGRGSLCINTGGEKVFAEEVEETLREHPAVADAGVFGVPDARLGEAVVAIAEISSGLNASPEELIEHVRGRLAHFKAPKRILVVSSAIRGDNGKLRYGQLREQYLESIAR